MFRSQGLPKQAAGQAQPGALRFRLSAGAPGGQVKRAGTQASGLEDGPTGDTCAEVWVRRLLRARRAGEPGTLEGELGGELGRKAGTRSEGGSRPLGRLGKAMPW